MNVDVYNAFFQRYSDAFNTQDTDAITALYVFPVEFVSDGKKYKFKDRAAFLDNLYRLLGIYQRIGVKSVIFRVRENESNHKSALVHWTMLAADNRKILDFTTRYHFSRKQPLINCVEVHEEPAKLRKLLGTT